MSDGSSTVIGTIGHGSAGDLAFNGARLFLASTNNELVEVHLSNGAQGTVVGLIGVDNVFGLTTIDNGSLYGFAGTEIFTINSFTGAADLESVVDLGGQGVGLVNGSAERPIEDLDGDGLPDYWETSVGLDPNDPNDANDDDDGDFLSNADEFALGTDPRDSDTDVDGISDFLEVAQGSDPLDASDTLGVPQIARPAEATLFLVTDEGLLFGTGSDNCSLARDKPSVVLTHGVSRIAQFDGSPNTLWTGLGDRRAATLIRDQISPESDGLNIFVFRWDGAFSVNGAVDRLEYFRAHRNHTTAGVLLGQQLNECLGPDYTESVHFIGHSMGTPVNAQGAFFFLDQHANNTVQFTSLDRPHHISRIRAVVGTNRARSEDEQAFLSIVDEDGELFEDRFGFDDMYFGSVFNSLEIPLPACAAGEDQSCLRLDNYFTRDTNLTNGTGVGDVANGGIAYNHLPPDGLVNPNDLDSALFDEQKIFGNNHSGVHQWYRLTISPNASAFTAEEPICEDGVFNPPALFLDDSLDPCGSGWQWSLNGSDPSAWPGPPKTVELQVDGVPPIFEQDLADGFGFTVTTAVTGDLRIELTEASSPYVVIPFRIDSDVSSISFRFGFENEGDGDYAAVFVNNTLLWSVAGTTVGAGQTIELLSNLVYDKPTQAAALL